MVNGICAAEGCDRTACKRGRCERHYRAWFKANLAPECSVSRCPEPVISGGLCSMHYNRQRKTGDVGPAERQNDGSAARQICTVCNERPVGPKGGKGVCPRCIARRRTEQIIAAKIPCEVPKCKNFVTGAGRRMCSMHKVRLRKTGSVGPPESYVGPRGEGTIDAHGYRHITVPPIRPGGKSRRRLEHRVIMEGLLGRKLKRSESVHHVNGRRADNRTDGPPVNFRSGNLELWSSVQPSGQRVADKIEFAVELLREYAPDLLADPAVRPLAS